MKTISFFCSMLLWLAFSADVNAQSNTAAQELSTDTPGSNIDLTVPVPEPPHVIGDDGQKVYFLANPSTTPKEPSGKQVEINQRQSNSEQPARKPE